MTRKWVWSAFERPFWACLQLQWLRKACGHSWLGHASKKNSTYLDARWPLKYIEYFFYIYIYIHTWNCFVLWSLVLNFWFQEISYVASGWSIGCSFFDLAEICVSDIHQWWMSDMLIPMSGYLAESDSYPTARWLYPTSSTGGCRIHMFLRTWNNKWQIKQKPKTRRKNKQEKNEIELNKGFDWDVLSVLMQWFSLYGSWVPWAAPPIAQNFRLSPAKWWQPGKWMTMTRMTCSEHLRRCQPWVNLKPGLWSAGLWTVQRIASTLHQRQFPNVKPSLVHLRPGVGAGVGWRSVERETVMKNVRIFHRELSVGFEIIQVYHPNKVPLEKVEPLSLNYAKGGG